LFLSGLDLANTSTKLSLSLLTEWICGMAGQETAQEDATDIIRVIIAGISEIFTFNSMIVSICVHILLDST